MCRIRRTVYITPPGAVLQTRLLDNQEGANTERYGLRKALGEMLPTPNFLAPKLFQLWRYRAWTIGPGVCDIHGRVRYVRCTLTIHYCCCCTACSDGYRNNTAPHTVYRNTLSVSGYRHRKKKGVRCRYHTDTVIRHSGICHPLCKKASIRHLKVPTA